MNSGRLSTESRDGCNAAMRAALGAFWYTKKVISPAPERYTSYDTQRWIVDLDWKGKTEAESPVHTTTANGGLFVITFTLGSHPSSPPPTAHGNHSFQTTVYQNSSDVFDRGSLAYNYVACASRALTSAPPLRRISARPLQKRECGLNLFSETFGVHPLVCPDFTT